MIKELEEASRLSSSRPQGLFMRGDGNESKPFTATAVNVLEQGKPVADGCGLAQKIPLRSIIDP